MAMADAGRWKPADFIDRSCCISSLPTASVGGYSWDMRGAKHRAEFDPGIVDEY